MTSKERANKILSDLHIANAVGDESQKWILTFSHSPSVIKPSQQWERAGSVLHQTLYESDTLSDAW